MSVCVGGKELSGHERELALAMESLLASSPTAAAALPGGAGSLLDGMATRALGSFERHDSTLDYSLKVYCAVHRASNLFALFLDAAARSQRYLLISNQSIESY